MDKPFKAPPAVVRAIWFEPILHKPEVELLLNCKEGDEADPSSKEIVPDPPQPVHDPTVILPVKLAEPITVKGLVADVVPIPTFPCTAKPLVGITELAKELPTPTLPTTASLAPGAEVPRPTELVEVVR